MQRLLHVSLGAVSTTQCRYWRPGLITEYAKASVPVLQLPVQHNPRAFLDNPPPGTTLLRFSNTLPTAPLAERVDLPSASDDTTLPPPTKKIRHTEQKDPDDFVLRAYHIRIRPDKHARAALRHMMAGVNATHNMVVERLKASNGFQNKQEIRNLLVPSDKLPENKKWLASVPTQPKCNKVRQLVGAYNKDLLHKGPQGFEMKFQSLRKAISLTMEFDGWKGTNKGVIRSLSRDDSFTGTARTHGFAHLSAISTIYANGDKVPSESLKVKICDSPWLMEHLLEHGLERAYRIKWDRPLNRWWLIVVVEKKKTQGPVNDLRNAVSLDPGSRSFQTSYHPSGFTMKFGQATTDRVKQLCTTVDRRVSRLAAYKEAQKERRKSPPVQPVERNQEMRMRYRNAMRKTRYLQHAASRKVHNTVTALHWNTINVLFGMYDTVLIPEFKTGSMLPNLPSRVARNMATLSHYTFRQRLLCKAEENLNNQVFVTREPGTSKTCCLCGTWNEDLGSGDVLHCRGCRVSIDRDVNGACGNMLAYVTEIPIH